MQILIVGDEVVIANHMLEVLDMAGFEQCKIAYTAGMAKDLLSTKDFDLVLLDIRMDHDDSGLELAHYINEELGIPLISRCS